MATKTKKFWTFVGERETIRIRKERGDDPPFTDDPRMRDYYFPNLRRTDDPATVWLHGALLRRLESPDQIVLASAAFRLTGGSIAAGEAMVPMFTGPGFDADILLGTLGPLKAPFNGTVHRHLRMATLADLSAAACTLGAANGYWPLLKGASLYDAHRALKRTPKIGPDLAYEIVCDLRRTAVLRDASDVRTWAHPGLSAVLAAGAITDNDWRHTRQADRQGTLQLMRFLLAEAQMDYPDWELSEIQRSLTLYHFWAREGKPTRRYRWK